MLRHVSFAPNITPTDTPRRCNFRDSWRPPSFLYRHYTNIYPRPFPSYINLHGVGDSFLLSYFLRSE